jgi:organic radical activating enzyme
MNNFKDNYTSNQTKLLFHTQRLNDMKNGIFRPISMHFSLTDKCNLDCEFCSNKKRDGYEFTFEEVKNILNAFSTLGAISVEFTGGEPTLHKNINDIISYAKLIGFSIGLKSNGVNIKKHLTEDSIKALTWLRISLNSFDYVSDNQLDFTGISKLTALGFSYVYTNKTNDDIFKKLKLFSYKYNASYVRIIPDNSYDVDKLRMLDKTIKMNSIFNETGFFWHEKNYSIPEKCWMMWIKPFINTDKNIYYCCATQMFERKLIPKYKLCSTNTEDIIQTWMNPNVFSGNMCNGGICYYKNHNEMIQKIVEGNPHSDFI